ncbi:N/A [soil metagenome]
MSASWPLLFLGQGEEAFPVSVLVLAVVLSRVGGLVGTAPAWGTPGVGVRFRLVLAGLLAMALAPVVALDLPEPSGPVELGRWCLVEAAVGAAIGMTATLILASARLAGEIIGAQAGLSPAALIDPDSGADMTPTGHLYGLIALAVFLILDGPLHLLGVLVESYGVLPVGGWTFSAEVVTHAFGRIGLAIGLALRIAAPVGLALVLAGAVIGLLGRAGPAFQSMAMSLPARALLGMFFVLLGLGVLVGVLSAGWEEVLGSWLLLEGR